MSSSTAKRPVGAIGIVGGGAQGGEAQDGGIQNGGAQGEPVISSPAPLARLFVRTAANGTVIRAYAADVARPSVTGPPWWTPPAWCFPTGLVQADVSTDAAVGFANGSLYAQRQVGRVGGDVTLIGTTEGDPTWVVVAQGPVGAAQLRAVFPGGGEDDMTPVNGVAVLTGHAISPTGTVVIEALDSSGATLGQATISAPGSSTHSDFTQCNAPEHLPPPGAQPADPIAATSAITQLVSDAFNNGLSQARFLALFDDWHGLVGALQQLQAGSTASEADAAKVPKLDGLVFLSPTEAVVHFTIVVLGYTSFSQRFGEAVLIDGTWKLTRATWCDQVTLAGVTCPS